MAGRKGPKTVVSKAEASKTTDSGSVTIIEMATGTVEAAVAVATAAPEPRGEEVALPG